MDYKSETKKGEVTMRGKYQNPNTSQSNGIPAEFLDEEGNWKMLTWREKAMLTEGQLYAYERFWMSVVDERILREAAVKKGYNEGWESGMKGGMKEGLAEGERNERLKNAKSLKANGVTADVIAKSLGLTPEEIENL